MNFIGMQSPANLEMYKLCQFTPEINLSWQITYAIYLRIQVYFIYSCW